MPTDRPLVCWLARIAGASPARLRSVLQFWREAKWAWLDEVFSGDRPFEERVQEELNALLQDMVGLGLRAKGQWKQNGEFVIVVPHRHVQRLWQRRSLPAVRAVLRRVKVVQEEPNGWQVAVSSIALLASGGVGAGAALSGGV